jgi:hypothetical protein
MPTFRQIQPHRCPRPSEGPTDAAAQVAARRTRASSRNRAPFHSVREVSSRLHGPFSRNAYIVAYGEASRALHPRRNGAAVCRARGWSATHPTCSARTGEPDGVITLSGDRIRSSQGSPANTIRSGGAERRRTEKRFSACRWPVRRAARTPSDARRGGPPCCCGPPQAVRRAVRRLRRGGADR